MVVERNIAVLGTIEGNQQDYKTFNGTCGKMDDIIAMNFPWSLIEDLILSCHCRNQTRHYYPMKLATQEVLMFSSTNLTSVANYLFTKCGGSILMAKLREY